MKAYTTNPSIFDFALVKKVSVIIIVIVLALVCCSCGSTKAIQTIPVETIKEVNIHDTLVIHDVQYDSVYVSQDKYTDRSLDTLLIKETNTVYKYKLLRDTIERVKLEVIRDSIPYEVRITEVKEVPRKRTWMDHLCYTITGIVSGLILVWFLRKFRFIP